MQWKFTQSKQKTQDNQKIYIVNTSVSDQPIAHKKLSVKQFENDKIIDTIVKSYITANQRIHK